MSGRDTSLSLYTLVDRQTGTEIDLGDVAVANDLTNFVDSTAPVVTAPIGLKDYTVATVPDATLFLNHVIVVTNDVAGYTLAVSNGTNWINVKTGAAVSV